MLFEPSAQASQAETQGSAGSVSPPGGRMGDDLFPGSLRGLATHFLGVV